MCLAYTFLETVTILLSSSLSNDFLVKPENLPWSWRRTDDVSKIMIAVDSKPDDLHTLDATTKSSRVKISLCYQAWLHSLEAANSTKMFTINCLLMQPQSLKQIQFLHNHWFRNRINARMAKCDEKTSGFRNYGPISIELQLMKLRPNMIVVTTDIDGSPKARTGQDWPDEVMAEKQKTNSSIEKSIYN